MPGSKWKTLSGEKIDNILDYVEQSVRSNGGSKIIHIGTDSLQTGRFTQFVTVLVLLTVREDGRGGGGKVAYSREVVPRISSLRDRLTKEVWRSLELAMQLDGYDLTVHIDANPLEKHKSSKYLQELVGMVVGQGFKALWKPDSWAATHCADHVVRTKGKLPRNGAQSGLNPVGAR
jgi:predicted RNase H-related nuclease YkuK (DUF458 family)